jgi:hypothetical protein
MSTKLVSASRASSLKPTGSYTFVGGRTHGAASIQGALSTWRTQLRDDATKRTDGFVAQGMPRGEARKKAEKEIADEWALVGYPWHRFDHLLVLDHTGWECHHIHENSWGGGDAPSNLIYLNVTEHSEFSGWFDARRNAIKKDLGIP